MYRKISPKPDAIKASDIANSAKRLRRVIPFTYLIIHLGGILIIASLSIFPWRPGFFEGGGHVRVAFLGGRDWVVAFLVPDLAADFHVDVALVTSGMNKAKKLGVINLPAFAGEHEARAAVLDDRVLHMDKASPGNHGLDGFRQRDVPMDKVTV
ncbi:uncharacterized protein METZ01_LOCUS383346, partial [marine metagenome]